MEDGIQTVAGLTFRNPTGSEKGPSGRVWGNLLQKHEFETVEQLRTRIESLDVVEERSVQMDGETLKGFKAIRSTRSGKVYSIPSSQYVAVQDRDVFAPFAQMCEERGLRPIGRVDGVGTGRTKGYVFFANPEFTMTLLEDYEDTAMLGVRVFNSYDTGTAWGAEVVSIRTVCINFNMWGDLIAKFRLTHKAKEGEVMSRFHGLITKELNESTILGVRKVMSDAQGTPVIETELEDLLWGLKLPLGEIEAIVSNPAKFCPEVQSLGLTGYTVYNMATNAATWRDGSGKYLQSTENYARTAVDVLTEKHDELIERGQARKKAYQEMVQKQQEKRERARKDDLLETIQVRTVA